MSEENKPDEGKVDLSAELEKQRKEVERLVNTVKSFQAKEAEFEKTKTEYERSKLTEAERLKAEQEEIRRERDRFAAEAREAKEQLAVQEKVNDLVAVHGLRNPEFGPVMLKQIQEGESLDDFAKRLKASPKYRDVFGPRSEQEPQEEQRERKKAPPAASGASGSRAKTAEVTQDDKDWAARRAPGDEKRQKALLDGLLKTRRGE